MNPVLIIDTSIIGVSMAIADMSPGGALIWSKLHPENMGSVPAVGSMLQEGLAAAGLTVEQIAGICVSHGPGSFTGIKVGLAFAFGIRLARATPLPMLGVSALEAALTQIAQERSSELLRLFLPATRTHGFMATLKTGSAEAQLVEAGSAALAAELGTSSNDSINLVFRDWPLLLDTAGTGGAGTLAGKPTEIIDEIRMCNAAVYGMAETARKNWPHGFRDENPEPRYLRLSTAEEKLHPQG
jgi:tRNA threonylcarbamoyladenosine biosynthesis protein TsaB